MKRKLRAIWSILFCEHYLLVTRKKNSDGAKFTYTMSDRDTLRLTTFLKNFLEKGEETLREAKDILRI